MRRDQRAGLCRPVRLAQGGKCRRLRRDRQTPTLLRRILQQSYYLAAVKLLDAPPAWGALSGVRPTKLTTQHILAGGDRRSADRLLRDTFYVSPARRALCLDASAASVEAAGLLEPVLAHIARFDILSPHGIIVAEHPADKVLPALAPPYFIHRTYRYGKIGLTVYHRAGNEESPQ